MPYPEASQRPLPQACFFLGKMGTFCRFLFPDCCKAETVSLQTILLLESKIKT